MRVFETNNPPAVIRLQYNFYTWNLEVNGCELAESMLVGDTLHVRTTNGTVIIPRDGSYVRFISDSWYSDIDVQNL